MSIDESANMNGEPEAPRAEQVSYNPPAPPPRKPVRWWIPVGIGCAAFALLVPLFVIFVIAAVIGGGLGSSSIGDRVALIHVEGVITGGDSGGGLFGGSVAGSERIVAQLEKARKDDNIRAIVIRINSPGGSAAGSQEVYQEIRRVRLEKKVYASMGDVAASGGYYIASACDKIFANGSTITGSIGVIMETTDMSKLFGKIGVSPQVVKSGKFKDIGSSNRPLTPDERKLIQGMIDDTYEQFLEAVSTGRNLPESEVRKIADGRVFTGRQALELKLVDKIGGLRDTLLTAAHENGITGDPRVEKYDGRGGVLDMLRSGSTEERYGAREYDLLLDRLIERFSSSSDSIESMR